MRVVVVTTSLTGGGAEFVGRTWAEWLQANGHEVRVFTTDPSSPPDSGSPLRVSSLGGRSAFGTVRALRRVLAGEPADVVVALQSLPNLVAIAAVRDRRDRPALLVSERNITTREHEPSSAAERAKLWLAKRLYRRADAVIAVSHAVAAELVSEFRVPGDRIVIVPNPAARSAEERVAEGWARPSAGADDDTLHVVLPMRVVPQKRPDLAVAAVAQLRSEGTDARLLCFGQGQGIVELEAAARAADVPLAMGGWTHDWVSQSPANSVAVLPSYREGFGNVLVEAALGGIPSVAVSNSYGVADALVPTVTGELAFVGTKEDLAAAIRRARRSSPRYVSGWARRFSREHSGRLLLRSMDKALATRNAGTPRARIGPTE
ncbi:glycosyltransferase [Microbacterium sp. NPDC019599]|uniref:glycosyltransferase n=1 Tax=Microbacterium sp. NPDC019599 TaxID=3154690 RepID=UPI0033CDF957